MHQLVYINQYIYIVLMQDMNVENYSKIAKQIEHNKLDVSLVEDAIKWEIQRNKRINKYPAAIKLAQVHDKASRYGYRDEGASMPKICACCLKTVKYQSLSLCEDTTQITDEIQLGQQSLRQVQGVSFYFSFLKCTLYSLFILVALYGIPTGVANAKSTNQLCNENPTQTYCSNNFTTIAHRSNATSYLTEDLLFLSVIVVEIIFFIIYYKIQLRLQKYFAKKQITQASYTIMISNLPLIDFPKKAESQSQTQFLYRKHLQQYLQSLIHLWADEISQSTTDSSEQQFLSLLKENGGQLKSKEVVKSISQCYDLTQLKRLQQARDLLINLKEVEKSTSLLQGDTLQSIPKQVNFVSDCSIVLKQQYAIDNSLLFNLTHFLGYAFVSFQYQHYRNYFLNTYNKNRKSFLYHGSYLDISFAQPPQYVRWNNFISSNRQKNTIKLQFLLIFAVMELVSLLGILLMDKTIYSQITQYNTKVIFFISQAIFIQLTNSLFRMLLRNSLRQQHHKTKTKEYKLYIIESVLLTTINSVGIMVGCGLLFLTLDDLTLLLWIFTIMTLKRNIIMQFVQPKLLWRYLTKACKYSNQTVDTFQITLNNIFQPTKFQIVQRYSWYLQSMYFIAFNSYLCPLLVVVLFGAIFLQYWIDKFNLFKRMSLRQPTNYEVFAVGMKMLYMWPIIASVEYLIESICVRTTPSVSIDIAIGISALFALFQAFAGMNIFGKVDTLKLLYDNCLASGKFKDTYWKINPVTTLIAESSVTKKNKPMNTALNRLFADSVE